MNNICDKSLQYGDKYLKLTWMKIPFLCFSNINWEDYAKHFILNLEDYSIEKVLTRYPGKLSKMMTYILVNQPYYIKDGKAILCSLFSNKLYSYENKNISTEIVFSEGREDVNMNNLKQKMKEKEENYLQVLSSFVEDKEYTPGIRNIFETDHFIFYDYYRDLMMIYGFLWNKDQNKGICISEYSNPSPELGSIFYCFENTLVRIW